MDVPTTFEVNKAKILENFNKLPINSKYGGKKYKFDTFDAIDCSVPFNAVLPPQEKKRRAQNTFVEDRESQLKNTRCVAKTFYYSEGFLYTDDGNHYGEVMNETKGICRSKRWCKECYYNFNDGGLGLLHYSTHSMNYNEIKQKMLDRLAVLSQFKDRTTVANCSKFSKNTHYCKFNANLMSHGDNAMAKKLYAKRQQKCATGVIRQTAPAALFSSQDWKGLM